MVIACMNIALKPDQQRWLDDQIAAGTFASVDDAVQLAVAGLMAPADDDLAWALPHIEEARAAIARGEGVDASIVKAELLERLRNFGA